MFQWIISPQEAGIWENIVSLPKEEDISKQQAVSDSMLITDNEKQ